MEEYRVTLDKGGANRDFIFLGGPLDAENPPPDLFSAIGYAASSWARLEQHLDAVLIHINNPAHSEAIYNPAHPIGLGAKLKLLKRWFNQHPALASLSSDFRELSSRLKEISPHRNNMLHGILERWEPETRTAYFQTIKFMGDDEFQVSTHEYTLEAIKAFSDITNAGNRYLSAISRSIFTPDALEQLKKP